MRWMAWTAIGMACWMPAAWAEPPTHLQPVHAELIAEMKSVQPGRPVWVALRLRLQPGWHTYWLNPGDSGVATQVRWQLPEGWQAGALQWPAPERLRVAGGVDFGYRDDVWLLAELRPPQTLQPGTEAVIGAHAAWAACRDLCVNGDAEVILRLPVATGASVPDPRWAAGFADTRARLPQADPAWRFDAAAEDRHLLLRVHLPTPAVVKTALFFPIQPSVVDHAASQPMTGASEEATLSLTLSTRAAGSPERLQGVLVIWREAEERALWVDVPVHHAAP